MSVYIRNAWYVAGWSEQLPDAAPLAVRILGEPLVIYRRADGAVSAFEDRCVHRLAPLSMGRCEGNNLRCMYHGLLFAPDGKVIKIPGQDIVPPQARVRNYPVVIKHSWIWVWMGDPALASQELVPPAVGLDDPSYVLGHGHLDYEAEASLINDNLLDFSHLSYVHAQSFGSGPEFAESHADIRPIERGVRYQRWIENSLGSSFRTASEPTDSFMVYDFLIPGILLMQSAAFPTGTAREVGYGIPDFAKASSGRSFTSQAVTPTQDGRARYFFSWGPHVDHGGSQQRDQMMEVAGRAFAEDKLMIEGQQQIINMTLDPKIMPTTHDKGVTLFHRLLLKLSKDESS